MQIVKSDGSRQSFMPNKVLKRIKDQARGLNVNPDKVFVDCVSGIVDGMNTKDIDNLIALTAADKIIEDPDYSYLASRIVLTRQGKIIGQEPVQSDYLYDFFGTSSFLYKYSSRDEQGTPVELPHMMYKRVADFIHDDDKREAVKLYDELRYKNIGLATPILTNFGTGKNTGISCNITTLKGDDTEDILDTLNGIARSSRDGAGIGLHIHNLRSKHSLVSSFKGYAAGVVRFCDMVQSKMRFFKQGNRSGSAAVYLGIWHRDIEDFLELRLQAGDERMRMRDLFTAVCIPDLFMEKLNSETDDDWYLFCPNEVKKAGFKALHDIWGQEFKDVYGQLVEAGLGYKVSVREIWNKILRSQVEAGLPYTFFWDNANKRNPQSNIGIRRGSNLCVSGDTLLLTDQGNIPISELDGEVVNVWNGGSFEPAPVFQTSDSEVLYRVGLSDGNYLDCTENHRWFVKNSYRKSAEECSTIGLQIGDKLDKWDLPLTANLGTEILPYAYTQGFYSGDGCENKGKKNNMGAEIVLYHEKIKLLPFIDRRQKFTSEGGDYIHYINDLKVRVGMPLDIKPKSFVPGENYTQQSKLDWLAGVCDSDGVIATSNGFKTLQIASIELDFLLKIKVLLESFGIPSKINEMHQASEKMLPKNDGTGESKLYNCQTVYRLLITSNGLYNLVTKYDVPFKRLDKDIKQPNRDARRLIQIKSITKLEGLHKTYCVTEPQTSKATFNNILTGNCIEYLGVSGRDFTSQCDLGLVVLNNVEKNDFKEIARRTKIVTFALNKVIDKNDWSTPEAAKAGKEHRTIGIGIAGLADYMAKHRIVFDSDEAKEFNARLLETIYKAAKATSSKLAVSYYGKSYDCWEGSEYQKEGTPMANSLLVCLMPSASTSVLIGCNESFEPYHSNLFLRRIDVGEFVVVNPYLVRDLKELGLWTEDVRKEIIANEGSVQGVVSIPEDIQLRYRTVWEIKQKELINLAAIRQEFIDQAQSMNLYFVEPSTAKVGGALNHAWKLGLPTGSYYTKSKSKQEAPTRLAQEKKTSTVLSNGLQIDCFGCSS